MACPERSGGGDEKAFQSRWRQTLESAIPQAIEAETKD
jgi:hypothetical protein